MPKAILPVSVTAVLIAVVFTYITIKKPQTAGEPSGSHPNTMQLTSPFFTHNGSYPSKYTCDGENIIPPFNIGDVPSRAKSLAIVLRDPDAVEGIFIHWIIFNIDPKTDEIQMGTVPHGAVQGQTTDKKDHYVGPCPPSGTHRYIFTLYALDEKLDLPAGVQIDEFNAAINGHVIDKAELLALYR